MRNAQEPTLRIGRREFTAQGILLLLSGVTVFVSACSDSSPSPTSPSGSQDVSGTISANHGHTAVITGAQLSAGDQVTLDIRGTADHTHSVDLSSAEIMQVAQRQRVSKLSSVSRDGAFGTHQHTVTFN